MNFSRLSLIATFAIATFTSHAFAADNLADAFKNGKFSGEMRAYYFDKDNNTKDENILATGLMLHYMTESYQGFKAGFTFQSSSTPFASEDAKTMFRNDMWAQGAQLSEAYLGYSMKNVNAKVGRMYLGTPLIAGSGSRLIKEAFEGAIVTNTDIPHTTLGAMYVDKYQKRTNKKGNIGEFDSYGDGVYSLYAINKSISGLVLTGAWANVKDYDAVLGTTTQTDLDIYTAEAVYSSKIGAFGYNLSGQYWLNQYSAGINDSIHGYGLKVGGSYADVSSYIAYSKISDDAVSSGYLSHGVGNGSDLIYTNSLIASYNYEPDMQAYALYIDYALLAGAKMGALYVSTDTDAQNASYTGVFTSYNFSGALKGLSVVAQYETKGKDLDGDEFRFKGSYKF